MGTKERSKLTKEEQAAFIKWYNSQPDKSTKIDILLLWWYNNVRNK